MNKKIVVAGAAALLATGVAMANGLNTSSLKTSPQMSQASHMTLADNCGGCAGSCKGSSNGSCGGSCGGCGGCGSE